jgi:hypothetical protein
MEINVKLELSNCEVIFDSDKIILKWKDNLRFKIRDQIKIILNNLDPNIIIDTNKLAENLIQITNSRTYMPIDEHTRFFFNCDRIERNSDRTLSPKSKFYKNYISYYNITEFGIKFKDIISFITFMKIGEDNWKNHEYFFFLRDRQETHDGESMLRRVKSF